MSDERYVVVQEVWVQCSADYHAARNTRTLVVQPETTVREIMEWGTRAKALASGAVILTREDRSDG